MINGRRVLAVIPARGGSKRVPRKNIREVAGKPLIAWTINAAKGSRYIDRCIVSTDDEEVADIARQCGGDVPFMRPAEFARDDSSSIDVLRHAVGKVPGYDIIVLLQPTSPERTSADIDAALETGKIPLVSTCDGKPNGAVYVCADRVPNTFALAHHFEIPKDRSLDIDTEHDLFIADRRLSGQALDWDG